MTIQQLKYIVAVNRYRSFARAAEYCGVTQPTLSGMLLKLEEELGARIFDRTNKHVSPTLIGSSIIAQAENTIAEANRIFDIISEAQDSISGHLSLCISPNIAPYLLPKFIKHYVAAYPDVKLTIEDAKASSIPEILLHGNPDAGIATAGHATDGVYEIPLYTEKFMAYISANCLRKLPVFHLDNLEHENMWIMKDSQCLRNSAFSFCKERGKGHRIYEAGNIETLIRIVDENGGYTIIPEMHVAMLSDEQKANVRDIDAYHPAERKVSLYIKSDYIRQKMLNSIVDTLTRFMPQKMFEPKILKFGIKL